MSRILRFLPEQCCFYGILQAHSDCAMVHSANRDSLTDYPIQFVSAESISHNFQTIELRFKTQEEFKFEGYFAFLTVAD